MKHQRRFRTNFVKRVLAMMIDALPLLLLATFICKEFFRISPYPDSDLTTPLAERLAELQALGIVSLAVMLAWATIGTLAEAMPGQATFGKRLLGLRVCDLNGTPLGFPRTFIRNFSKLLSAIPLGIGFFTAMFSFNSRAWHDFLAKAVVVEVRK